MKKTINLTLKIWRQKNQNTPGKIETYPLKDLNVNISFLEMLDILNDQLEAKGEEPVAFEHDCREGICGSCGIMINGKAHGGYKQTTTCQLHLRKFSDGEEIYLEPWRSRSFPVIKDLVVNRNAFDKIIKSGGYVSVRVGSAPEANSTPIPKKDADLAFGAATCIGCGACVATCKNSSASLFMAAKVSHLSLLPQGKVERKSRVLNMVKTMDDLGFGACTNEAECEVACPKGISFSYIANMNKELLKANLK